MIIPVVLMITITDFTFLYQARIYVLSTLIEGNRVNLFKFLTCGTVDVATFRDKYMSDSVFTASGDDEKDQGNMLNMRLKNTVIAKDDNSDGGKDSQGEGEGERNDSIAKPEDVKPIVGKTRKEKVKDQLNDLAKEMGLLNKKPENQHELFAGKNASSRSSNTESDASPMVLREESSSGRRGKTTDSGQNKNQQSSSPKEASGSEGLIDVSRSQHAIGAGLDHIGERELLSSDFRDPSPKDVSDSVGDGLGEASRMQGNPRRDRTPPKIIEEESNPRQRPYQNDKDEPFDGMASSQRKNTLVQKPEAPQSVESEPDEDNSESVDKRKRNSRSQNGRSGSKSKKSRGGNRKRRGMAVQRSDDDDEEDRPARRQPKSRGRTSDDKSGEVSQRKPRSQARPNNGPLKRGRMEEFRKEQ